MNTKNEWMITAVLGLAATVSIFLWLSMIPAPPSDPSHRVDGDVLFDSFRDPHDIRSLSITRWNDLGERESLRIVRNDSDGWTIPDKGDAPADNTDRMAMVVTPLLDLVVLDRTDANILRAGRFCPPPRRSTTEERLPPEHLKPLSSRLRYTTENGEKITTLHRQTGLLDPIRCERSEFDDAAVSVEIKGAEESVLAKLLVGRSPQETSALRDIRYVRLPESDTVYTVDFSSGSNAVMGEERATHYPARLSTNPLDWMKKDLLRISRWNIATFSVFDYRVEPSGRLIPNGFFTVAQNPEHSIERVWSYTEQKTFDAKGAMIPLQNTDIDPTSLPDNRRWNEAADSVGHLVFLDLERKPDPLPEWFRRKRPIQELALNADLLAQYGFMITDHDPRKLDATDPFLAGVGGEIALTMTDGVSYRLVFGAKTGENSRWLLVTSDFDASFFAVLPNEVPNGAIPQTERADTKPTDDAPLLDIAEGEKKAAENSDRFDNWFFTINDDDYRKIFPQ